MTIKMTVTDIDSGLSMDGLPLRSWPLVGYNNSASAGLLLADYLIESGYASHPNWGELIYISPIEADHDYLTYPISFEYKPVERVYWLTIGCMTFRSIADLVNQLDHAVSTAYDEGRSPQIMRDLILPSALLILPTDYFEGEPVYGDYDDLIEALSGDLTDYNPRFSLMQSIVDHEMVREATWIDTRIDSKAIVAIDLAVAYGYGVEAVLVANHEYLTNTYGESVGKHGTYVIDLTDMSYDDLSSLYDDLENLRSYPVLDEDRWSEIEAEWQEASWLDYAHDEIDWNLLLIDGDNLATQIAMWDFIRLADEIGIWLEWSEHMDGGAWLDTDQVNNELSKAVSSMSLDELCDLVAKHLEIDYVGGQSDER